MKLKGEVKGLKNRSLSIQNYPKTPLKKDKFVNK